MASASSGRTVSISEDEQLQHRLRAPSSRQHRRPGNDFANASPSSTALRTSVASKGVAPDISVSARTCSTSDAPPRS
jgi:hypothetical protein